MFKLTEIEPTESTNACTTVSSITTDTYLFDTSTPDNVSLLKSAGGALQSLWA